MIDGKVKIIGKYEKVNHISKSLQKRLLENGMPKNILQKFVDECQKKDATKGYNLGGDLNE